MDRIEHRFERLVAKRIGIGNTLADRVRHAALCLPIEAARGRDLGSETMTDPGIAVLERL